MTRKVEVTAESVAEAAEALVADGVKVTTAAVRAKIGKGSYSTILPLLSKWDAAQKEREILIETDVPEAIVLNGEELIARIWRTAVDEASAGHDAIRRELIASEAETQDVRNEMAEIVQEVGAELEAAQEEAETLRVELVEQSKATDQVKERATIAERELAVASERARSAEGRATLAEQRVNRAESDVVELRSEAKELGEVAADLRAQVAALNAEGKGLKDQLAASQLAAKAAEDRAALNETRAVKAEIKADTRQSDLTKMAAEESARRAELVQARADHAATNETLKRARVEIKELENRIGEKEESEAAGSKNKPA